MKLNEDLRLPEGERLPNDWTDPVWDELFKKYLNYSSDDFCIIKVEDTPDKTGYIKFDMSIDPETGRRKNYIGAIDPDNVIVVSNRDEATRFKQDDADSFIRGVKENPITRNGKYTKERITSEGDKQEYSKLIMEEYFKTLSKGGNEAIAWLKPAEFQLFEISRRMTEKPLRGNHIFDIAAKMFQLHKEDHLSKNFVLDSSRVATIFNILRHKLVNYIDVVNLKNVKASSLYNPSLYKYNVEEIDKIFEIYDAVKKLSSLDSIETLRGVLISEDPLKAAINTMFIEDKEDLFKNILLNQDMSVSREEAIAAFNKEVSEEQDEYKIINTYIVRDPEQMESMLTAMGGNLEYSYTSNEKEAYYIQVFPSRDTYKGKLTRSEQTVTVVFKDVELIENSKIRLVLANEFNNTKSTLTDILPTLKNKKVNDSFKKLFKFSDKDNSYICITNADINIKAIFSVDNRGNLHLEEFNPFDIWETEIRDQSETERTSIKSSGQKKYGPEGTQFTLQQLLDLSNSRFQAIFDNFLSSEEQDEIRDIIKNKADLL